MIAVVTGGSGFIGSNLVQALLAGGHTVRCLVRPARPLTGRVAGRIEQATVSLTDEAAIAGTGMLDGADAVFHLAGATRALRARDFHLANVLPTQALARATTSRAPAARFVLVSSLAAAGPARAADRPRTEDDPAEPVEPYGASKLAAENIVRAIASLRFTIVRPAAVFGSRDRDFLPLFRMAARGIILWPGIASHHVSLIHVDDVVHALIAAATRDGATGATFFLETHPSRTWREVGDAMGAVAGRRVRHVNIPAGLARPVAMLGDAWAFIRGARPSLVSRYKARLGDFDHWICSGARARRELGLPGSRSLPDEIARTYLWYVEQGWLRRSARAGHPATS